MSGRSVSECSRAARGVTFRGSCIADMANGWILISDLCPACTREFMAALDAAFGPLPWHESYRERGVIDD